MRLRCFSPKKTKQLGPGSSYKLGLFHHTYTDYNSIYNWNGGLTSKRQTKVFEVPRAGLFATISIAINMTGEIVL